MASDTDNFTAELAPLSFKCKDCHGEDHDLRHKIKSMLDTNTNRIPINTELHNY